MLLYTSVCHFVAHLNMVKIHWSYTIFADDDDDDGDVGEDKRNISVDEIWHKFAPQIKELTIVMHPSQPLYLYSHSVFAHLFLCAVLLCAAITQLKICVTSIETIAKVSELTGVLYWHRHFIETYFSPDKINKQTAKSLFVKVIHSSHSLYLLSVVVHKSESRFCLISFPKFRFQFYSGFESLKQMKWKIHLMCLYFLL